MPFLSPDELRSLGLARCGENVLISSKASLYNSGMIAIGNHVRIDDFCVISAGDRGIEIGNFVHIAMFCSLIGAGKILLSDFSNLSSRVSLYSSTDDFTGEYMTNPTVSSRYTGVTHAPVTIGRHVVIGSGTVVLPGVAIGEGAAIGSLSLVKEDCEPFTVYAGIPVRPLKKRKTRILELEKQFLQETNSSS